MFTNKEFKLSDEEYENLKKWAETHECGNRGMSCCGGEISITFTPTTIGTHISAKCVCGKEFEIAEIC